MWKTTLALTLLATPAPAPSALQWSACPGDKVGMECADLRVPLDWAKPAGRTITLKLGRLKATGTAEGSALIAYGGPGAPGIALTQQMSDLWSGLRKRMNVVTWDTRGYGKQFQGLSTGLACTWTRTPIPAFPRDAAEWGRTADANRGLAEPCRQADPELFAHMSSADQARDMDAIRQALGERRLNYYGASYAGFYGQDYARLFPGNVRTIVLDGTWSHSAADWPAEVEAAARTNQQFMTRFFTWCRGEGDCPGIQRTWRNLITRANLTPIPAHRPPTPTPTTPPSARTPAPPATLETPIDRPATVPTQATFATPADRATAIQTSTSTADRATTTPSQADRPATVPARATPAGDATAAPAQAVADSDAFGYTGRDLRGLGLGMARQGPAAWPALAKAITAAARGDASGFVPPRGLRFPDQATGVTECLDWPRPASRAELDAAVKRLNKVAPDTGTAGTMAEGTLACLGWPVGVTNPPEPLPKGLPPMLGAGAWGESDAVTRVLTQVPGSATIRHEGPGHTLYLSNACARAHIDRYLTEARLPEPSETTC